MGNKWIEEELEPGLRVSYGLKEELRSSSSKFQTVDVVDLEPFGRTLLIDGLIQSCQVDEFVYHESLVHPALLAHPNPKQVYIGGGGEGSGDGGGAFGLGGGGGDGGGGGGARGRLAADAG